MDKIIEQKMCFDVLCNIYLKKKKYSKKNPARYGHKYTNLFM